MLLEFLTAVLPVKGVKCWVEISKDKKVIQGFVDSIPELAAKLKEIDSRGSDAYFACASYKNSRNRRQANVEAVKAFWLDVDAGGGKPYATAEDAIRACDEFCNRCSIELPGIVRSGGGIHAYWVLDTELNSEQWLHTAKHFKLLTEACGFHADAARTADASSILRAPGTKNNKLSIPRPVYVEDIELFEPVSFEDFSRSVLNGQCGTPAKNINDPLMAGLHVSRTAEISQGVSEGGRNSACAQMAGASFAKGRTFDEAMAECLEWNKKNQPPLDEQEVRTTVASIHRRHLESRPSVALQKPLPDLPSGYRWLEPEHQLQTRVKTGEQEFEWRTVSERPVYLESILNHEGFKESSSNSYLFRQYHTRKGWQQFTMDSEEFNSGEWYKHWFRHGGEINAGMDKYFKTYVREASVMLRRKGDELIKYSQFGWKDDDQAFLVGDSLCQADGAIVKAYGSHKLEPLMQAMTPARGGSLAAWTAAADKLFTPGMEAHGFMLLASLAAPLMKFCVDEGNGGSILSVVSEESGHGKTPMATAIASVWGELAATVVTGNFTENRRIEDLVRHCHLPQVQEEMSYGDPLVAAQGIEKITSGSDRGRLTQSGAASGMPERYQTIVISLSNKSLYELVKMVHVPMSRRIFELEIDRPPEEILSNIGGIAREMMNNCGHAGLALARIIVNPQIKDYIQAELRGSHMEKVGPTQMKYRKLLNSQPEHRFIVWLLSACDIVGRIATHYDLLHFDVDRIMTWAVDQGTVRTSRMPEVTDAPAKLDVFIREHANNYVAVQNAFSRRQGAQVPLRMPHGPLYMRLETKAERLYIAQDVLHEWCTRNNISFNRLGKKLKEENILIESSRLVTLGAGTGLPGGRTLCWAINLSALGFGELHLEVDNDQPESASLPE